MHELLIVSAPGQRIGHDKLHAGNPLHLGYVVLVQSLQPAKQTSRVFLGGQERLQGTVVTLKFIRGQTYQVVPEFFGARVDQSTQFTLGCRVVGLS